jgi:hypothetical protein
VLRPELPSCDECEQFVFDHEDHWKLKEYPPRSGNPLRREKGSLLPCEHCPKCALSPEKSPAVGRETELSEKNRQTLDLYYAIHGARLDNVTLDEITVANLGLVHQTIEECRRYQIPQPVTYVLNR